MSIHDAAMRGDVSTTDELANAGTSLETDSAQWLALARSKRSSAGFCRKNRPADLVPSSTRRAKSASASAASRGRDASRPDECSPLHRRRRVPDGDYKPEEVAGDTQVAAPADAQARASPAPALGADTDAVLEAAGIDAAERARLRAKGVV